MSGLLDTDHLIERLFQPLPEAKCILSAGEGADLNEEIWVRLLHRFHAGCYWSWFGLLIARVNSPYLHQSGAMTENAQLGGSSVGEVYDPVSMERSAIVYFHDGTAPIAQIGHFHIGGERQALVGCGHGIHVVGFTAAGGTAVKFGAIPGCDTALSVPSAAGHDGVAFSHHHVRAWVTPATLWFTFWYCVPDAVWIQPPGWGAILAAWKARDRRWANGTGRYQRSKQQQ